MEFYIRWATKFFLSCRVCPLVFLSFTPFFGLNMAGRNTQIRELLLSVTGVLVLSTKTVARLMSTDTKLRCLNQPRAQGIFDADYCYQENQFFTRQASSCIYNKGRDKVLFTKCQEKHDLHLSQRCDVHLSFDRHAREERTGCCSLGVGAKYICIHQVHLRGQRHIFT